IKTGAAAGQVARQSQTEAVQATVTILVVTVLIALGAMLYAFVGVSRPLAAMTQAVRRLADGDTEAAVPFAQRRDEIGDMSATVGSAGAPAGARRAAARPPPQAAGGAPRRTPRAKRGRGRGGRGRGAGRGWTRTTPTPAREKQTGGHTPQRKEPRTRSHEEAV